MTDTERSGIPSLLSLELLLSVAEHGSFSAAAREFGMSQQAVSARITAMETQIGLTLFLRHAAGVRLSDDGEVVLQWASPVIAAADHFHAGVAALRAESAAKPLRIAASLTIAEHLLPRWLLALYRSTGTAPSLVAINSSQVLRSVRSGAADLGFIESGKPPHDLSVQVIGADELVVAAPPRHRWSERKMVGLQELLAEPLLLREPGSGTREVFDAAVARAVTSRSSPGEEGRAVRVAAEFPSTSALVTAARDSGIPAVVSELSLTDELQSGRLVQVRVSSLDLHRQLHAVFSGAPSAAALALLAQTPGLRNHPE